MSNDREDMAVAVVPKAATELIELVLRSYNLVAEMAELCAANPLLLETVREDFETRANQTIDANDEAFSAICEGLLVLAGGAVNGSEEGFSDVPDRKEIQGRIDSRPEERFYYHDPAARAGTKWLRPYKKEAGASAERLGVSWLLERDPAAAFIEQQREEKATARCASTTKAATWRSCQQSR